MFIRTKARGTGAPVLALITLPNTVLGTTAVEDDGPVVGELLPDELLATCASRGPLIMTARTRKGSSKPQRRRQHTIRAGNTNGTSQKLRRNKTPWIDISESNNLTPNSSRETRLNYKEAVSRE